MNLLQIHEPGETPLPHEGGAAIGIDLGTTHSVAAWAQGGIATLLPDEQGVLIPSVVYYEGDEKEVGASARKRWEAGEPGAVASIKRLMGRSREDALALGFGSVLSPQEGMARLELGGRTLTPTEISGDILRHLKEAAEKTLGREVTQAVITVPAYFDDAARAATKDAARLAGLEVLRLINEPTAAALAYGLDNGAEGVYAVYDLGGGTFDISVLKLEKGVFQVLATGGDIALGGDDFDRAIAAAVSPAVAGGQKAALLSRARGVKERLTDQEETPLEWEGKTFRFTQSQLASLLSPFIEKTLAICARALEDAGFTPAQINGVVLVGGSTRTPFVRKKIAGFFGSEPLAGINPDEVVAVGAAIQAESLTQGGNHLLLDVVPLSLGLETMGGLVEKIIHRNTPIPVMAEQSFTTYQDGQNGMVIHVLQGEREMVDQNRSLARFELAGIPSLPAGIARVKVSFTVDADGLLSVAAREETTGVEQSVAVKPSYGLQEGEIERMLYESMEHGKSDILQRLLLESKMEAGRAIEEVKSAFAQDADLLQLPEKQAITGQMSSLEAAVAGGDRDLIDAEAEKLHALTRPFAERRMDRAIQSALKGAHIDDAAQG